MILPHNPTLSTLTARQERSVFMWSQERYIPILMHICSLHVIDSPACVCSHREEDTAHFFLDCPLYYVQRLAL